MNEVLYANIFFFITGISIIIFSAFFCVALFHFVKVLRAFRRIIERIEMGTEVIADDIQRFREYFMEGGFIGRIIAMMMGFNHNTHRQKSSVKQEKKKTELKIKDKE